MLKWISNYRYNYTMEEEGCLHAHFGYIWCHVSQLDEPHVPLITIKANVSYHYPYERTSQHNIAHMIVYYAYFRLARPPNPLRLCNSSLGTMSTRGLVELPSSRTRPLKFTRMWEISTMMRISRCLRLPTTGMLLVKRYLRERCFYPTRNVIPWETRVTISKIWLHPR